MSRPFLFSYPSPERGGSGAQRRGWGFISIGNAPTRLAALATPPRKRGRDKSYAALRHSLMRPTLATKSVIAASVASGASRCGECFAPASSATSTGQ